MSDITDYKKFGASSDVYNEDENIYISYQDLNSIFGDVLEDPFGPTITSFDYINNNELVYSCDLIDAKIESKISFSR